MSRFFRRIAEGVFDLEDLQMQTGDLAGFIGAASRKYGFPPEKVIAVGYSNGANIGASLLLLHPQVLAAAVLFHAMVPIIPETLPDLRGTSVFMGSGQFDTMIRPEQSTQLSELLTRAGAGVTLHWEPNGHGLNREEVQAAAQWLAALETARQRETS